MGLQQLVADMGEEVRRQLRIVTVTLRLDAAHGGSVGDFRLAALFTAK
jgi:hypothetical protein